MYVPVLLVRGRMMLIDQEEEVYFFRSDPRENGATVILTVDTNSFVGMSVFLPDQALLPFSVLLSQVSKLTRVWVRR